MELTWKKQKMLQKIQLNNLMQMKMMHTVFGEVKA